MRKYLSTLHQRSDNHKRRFALLSSGIVTLFIFGVWSLVNFGTTGGTLAENQIDTNSSGQEESQVSPFQSFRDSVASSFEAFRGSFTNIRSSLNSEDFEAGFDELKDGALDTYGQ